MAEVGQQGSPRLREALSGFATLLVDRYDVGDVLYRLCGVAADVTDATGVGILLEDVDGRLRYAAASDPMASRLEAIQLELGEGPCMLAHSTAEPVLIPELAAERRFDQFVPRAREQGVEAVFTLPLLHRGDSVGILDVYRDRASALTDGQMADAALTADMVTTAVLNRRLYDDSVTVAQQLQAALDARILMEQAKGRISERCGVSVEEAEDMIHARARGLGRPIGDIVRDIAAGTSTVEDDEPEAG